MLLRYHAGETKVWSVVKVPESADEDRRQLHRELIAVQDERTEHVNRIKAFLAGQGIALTTVTAKFPEHLSQLRCWDGAELGVNLQATAAARSLLAGVWRINTSRTSNESRKERICVWSRRRIVDKKAQLARLGGHRFVRLVAVGARTVRLAEVQESPAAGSHRRPDADAATKSGDLSREQGISKAGNRVVRRMLVELAWCLAALAARQAR